MTDQDAKSWWGPVWRGLVVDKNGKHIQQMGQSLWLFIYLIIHADREEGFLDRRYETIMTDMGIKNKSTVRNWMDRLKRYKYIQTTRRPYSLYIEICNWRSIKKRMLDIEQSQEKRVLIPEQESANSMAGECQIQVCVPKNKHSVNTEKQKVKGKRVLNNKQSKESIKESIKESTPPTPSKKQKKTKETNPDIKIAIDHFHGEFLRIFGFKPDINGAHRKIFKRQLIDSGRPIDQLKELITAFLESDDPYLIEHNFPIGLFPGQVNSLLIQIGKNGKEPSEEELKKHEERVKRGREKYEKEIGVGA